MCRINVELRATHGKVHPYDGQGNGQLASVIMVAFYVTGALLLIDLSWPNNHSATPMTLVPDRRSCSGRLGRAPSVYFALLT